MALNKDSSDSDIAQHLLAVLLGDETYVKGDASEFLRLMQKAGIDTRAFEPEMAGTV